MNNKEFIISIQEVPKLVTEIIKKLNSCKVILLNGEIGVGKTFLIKELAKQLGETGVVSSPSFQIMNVYEKLVHIDAYNLNGGLESYYDFFEDKIIVIEWSSNIKYQFSNYIEIKITYLDENKRLYDIKEVT